MKAKTIVVFLLALACVGFAFAQSPGGATVTASGDRGGLVAAGPGNVSLEAGNISYANLDTNMSTFRWVGLVGNVTGNIQLADSGNNVLYQWTASGNLVYASTASSITWSSLADASVGDMPGYLTGTDSDNYTNTFNFTTPQSIGSNLFTLTSDYAMTYDNVGADAWTTYSLIEGANLVWAGAVSEDGTSYLGDTVDFQMIIPEDGTAGDTTAATYNLWVELQ